MKIVYGDLIQLAITGEFDVIVHGCNCFHTMGAGIAKQIRNRFPQASSVDKETEFGDVYKLGTYTSVGIEREDGTVFTIVNAYTQYGYVYGQSNADYCAIINAFSKIADDYYGLRIAYPLIGCGLAGGDWNVVGDIIDKQLLGLDHTLVKYKP